MTVSFDSAEDESSSLSLVERMNRLQDNVVEKSEMWTIQALHRRTFRFVTNSWSSCIENVDVESRNKIQHRLSSDRMPGVS
jgi:hypothetical protein